MTYTLREALDDSVKKWEKIVREKKKRPKICYYDVKFDGKLSKLKANCGLCEYFQKKNMIDGFHFPFCNGCPLQDKEINGELAQCSREFFECRNHLTLRNAKKMLEKIKKIRKDYSDLHG